MRYGNARLALYVRLPFAVLAARAITVAPAGGSAAVDVTVRAAELLSWLDGDRSDAPPPRDAQWRGAVPPVAGWQRLDTVPDTVVRDLVRAGARTLRELAEREGTSGAQPRAEVTDVLLDAIVLTVSDDRGRSAPLTLRMLSAVTRLGFLTRDSQVGVDVAGRWTRVAAGYGSVYAERPGSGLSLL